MEIVVQFPVNFLFYIVYINENNFVEGVDYQKCDYIWSANYETLVFSI